MKTAAQREARALRSQHGLSIKSIAQALEVSPSSVSRWVRDIELTAEQERTLQAADPARNGRRVGQAAIATRAGESRRRAQARATARRIP